MTDPAAHESFIAKWRARWPEWTVAEAFVPAPQRDTMAAWFALLQELTDAAWSGEDPTPGHAKLGWWQEELQGWPQRRRRHPLGETLQSFSAPWDRLASALPALRDARETPDDAMRAMAALDEFSQACDEIEKSLFATTAGQGDAKAAIAASLLAAHPRLSEGGAGTRGGLLAHWPPLSGTRPRRIAAALARARLLAGSTTPRPLPAWRALWLAWRAARN